MSLWVLTLLLLTLSPSERGQLLFETGQYPDALEVAMGLLQDDPEDPWGHWLRLLVSDRSPRTTGSLANLYAQRYRKRPGDPARRVFHAHAVLISNDDGRLPAPGQSADWCPQLRRLLARPLDDPFLAYVGARTALVANRYCPSSTDRHLDTLRTAGQSVLQAERYRLLWLANQGAVRSGFVADAEALLARGPFLGALATLWGRDAAGDELEAARSFALERAEAALTGEEVDIRELYGALYVYRGADLPELAEQARLALLDASPELPDLHEPEGARALRGRIHRATWRATPEAALGSQPRS